MNKTRISDALGASRTVELPTRPAQGPLGLLQLRAELTDRLRSSGGRPTDPDWSVRRVVPFKPDKWRELEVIAERLSRPGRTVSPAQVAAMLIERGLTLVNIEDELKLDDLSDSSKRAS